MSIINAKQKASAVTTLKGAKKKHPVTESSRKAALKKKQRAAIASRQAYRAYLAKHRGGINEFEAIEFESLNDEGLIPVSATNKDLPFTFVAPTLEVAPNLATLSVVMRSRPSTVWPDALYNFRYSGTGAISPGDTISRDIPKALLREGLHEIAYILYESGIPTTSDIAPLEVDTTWPYRFNSLDANEVNIHPAALTVPDDLGGEITQEYIDDNPDGLLVGLPDYVRYGRKSSDTLTVYISEYSWASPDDVVDSVGVGDEDEFLLPWTKISLLEGGVYYLFYVLTDLARNPSKISLPVRLLVSLTLPPEPLEAEVPLARKPEDGLLDLADIYQPTVYVKIPEYDNMLPALDIIELWWAGELVGRFEVRLYLPQLLLPVPRSLILDAYSDGPGEVDTDIDYLIDRRGVEYSATTHTIKVDASVPGPEPTPDPENPAMLAPTVYGSDPDNPGELPPEDFGLDATVEVTVPADTVPGVRVKVYWGSFAELIGTYTIEDEVEGDVLIFIADWPTIRRVGNNPALKVFWTLSWDTNNNIQHSVSTYVNVQSNRILLEEPTFVKATTVMACSDLDQVYWTARVRIPGNTTYFKEHMRVRLVWQAYADITGDVPEGPAVSFLSPELTPDMVSNGWTQTISPFDPVIKLAGRNSVKVKYLVPIGDDEVPSEEAFTQTLFANRSTPPVYCPDLVALTKKPVKKNKPAKPRGNKH